MKWNEVFCHTFKAIREQTGPETKRKVDLILPSMPMVEACRTDRFDFFQPFIDAGRLTEEQMRRACDRYHLGKTRSGQPIYWMIDDMMTPLDAHIGEGWISTLLKKREPLLEYWRVMHCLFGLHLTTDSDKPISIVEREEAAVVLSEICPESIWLSYATNSHLMPDLFAPLEGRTVTIYPRTDPTMSTYVFFLDLAEHVREQLDIDLHIDGTLEEHATEAQKEQCIDVLDFLISSL